jgi:hypothetical protein
MIKPKRSAEQQVADEAEQRALNPTASRQTVSEAKPSLNSRKTTNAKADRLAREAADPKAQKK